MFKKYPFVKQNSINDCGVACLLMIIKYYKGDIPYQKLRIRLKTTDRGTTAYHIIECAKELGFNAVGLKGAYYNITCPAIAYTKVDNYNHFVVIYKIDKNNKKILITDPSNKQIKMTYEEFNKIYNNVVIELYPIKNIPIIKNETSIYRFIFNLLIENKKYLIYLFILSLFIMILTISSTFFFSLMINGDYKVIFFIFIFIILFKNIISFIRNKIFIRFSHKIDFSLTNDIFKNIVKLPYNIYRNHPTGDIVARVRDLSIIKEMINKTFLVVFMDLFLMIFSGVFLFIINRYLFLLSIVLVIGYLIILVIYKPIYKKYLLKIKQGQASNNSYMVESITGFETIKGLNMENNFIDFFNQQYQNHLKNVIRLDNHINNEITIKNILNDLIYMLIILVSVLLMINNQFTLVSIITFQLLFSYFVEPINRLIDLDSLIYDAKESFNRINDLTVDKCKKTGQKVIEFNKININNLTHIYNDQKVILDNITLKISNHEKIMIIGNSGSGKSTLLKIIKGYYEIENNNYLIDGVCFNKYDKELVQSKIAYISQNEFLLTNTIHENIVLHRDINQIELDEVIKICEVDKIINNNLGYNYLLEENGFNISGGEKQRIVLARTLLNDFEILLIDEGFSQIDKNMERRIIKNIFNKYKNKIIIIVSHKLDNMDLFDKTITINEGKIDKIIEKRR